MHKNHSNAPARNTAVVKEERKRQMRQKLLQANEAVRGETRKV